LAVTTRVPAAAAKNTRCVMEGRNFALRTLLVILIGFLFLSCDFDFDDDDAKTFWAKNIKTGSDYKVKAELLATGDYCNIWVEKGSGINKTQAKNIADEYDKKIHFQMIEVFGLENPSFTYKGNVMTFSDIMEFADWLGDEDGKLCILLLDIKDDYKKDVNESYVAGYFWNGNFLDVTGSNYCDMIYIDTYPGMVGENIEEAYSTLAHEMQHLMNYVTTRIKRSTPMDTWIDEGLSSAAEYIINKEHSSDRIDWYNGNGYSEANIKGLIDQGNNFYVWNNHKETQYAILDDYATVYLFFQWLRLQNDIGVYRKIISSTSSDYQAVTTATGKDWDYLLKNWMAANYINAGNGIYGYGGEISVTAHTFTSGTTQVSLYPGEGVYSLTTSGDTMPSQSGKINYAGLSKTSATVNNNINADGALLTYNINTVLDASAEIGTTTGKAASVIIKPGSSRAAMPYSGPYRIGAGDVLRQNWNNNDFTSWNFKDK
jgi:hypothetical protein